MKIVLDTNVLVSGIFFGGLPGRVFRSGALSRSFCRWPGSIAGIDGTGLIGLVIGFSLLGCSRDANPARPDLEVAPSELVKAMTSGAAVAIGSSGKLELAAPPNTGRSQISGEKAGVLATAVARHNLPYNHKLYDGQRGQALPYASLVVCGEPLYAWSAFERLAFDDPATAAHPLQKSIGPFWLVKLCAPGTAPQVNVAVSAYATDLGIRADGGVDFPAVGGGDFFAEGIPDSQRSDELPSAEAAVVFAANLTGRRVAAVPELIVPFWRDDSPFGARWRIRLDGPARLRDSSGRVAQFSEAYVSRIRTTVRTGSRSWTADSIQPGDVEVTFIPQGRVGEHIDVVLRRKAEGTKIMRANRRTGVPINFSTAVITP